MRIYLNLCKLNGFQRKLSYLFSNKNFLNQAGIFATAIGLLKLISIATHSIFLIKMSQTFAMSPAPNPYRHPSQIDPEDLKTGVLFGFEDSKGNISWQKWNYKIRNQIPGQHRRIVTLLSYMHNLWLLDNKASKYRFDFFIQNYFCNSGAIATAAQVVESPVAIRFQSLHEGEKEENLRIPCSK